MALLTWAQYKIITGDTTTVQATVEAAITTAVGALEGELRRPLESAEQTERLKVHYSPAFMGGRVYPTVTPVTDADDYDIISTSILASVSPDTSPFFVGGELYATVTYTGGYVERTASPTATNRLPGYVEADIAWAAFALTHQATTSLVPVGATSVRLGDASITYANPQTSRTDTQFGWSSKTLRLKARYI